MLKKENRLTVFGPKVKKKITTSLFDLGISNNDLGTSRFSFVISKKVNSKATVRNKTRRKLRSIIEEMLERIEKGRDFAFYIKKDAIDAKRDEISLELNQILLKNNLLK